MPIGGAIAVITVGAILTFALADGSVGGFDLRIAGVILMLGGALGLLLSLLLRNRSRWSRSTVRSRQDVIDDRPPPSPADSPGYEARQSRGRRPPSNSRSYAERWATLQEQFADAPGFAVREADRLISAVMAERGYPTDDFEQRQAELPAVYGRMLRRYHQAHEISWRIAQDDASTEDLRQAMVHYHVLFQELLDNSDEHHHPQPAGQTHDNQPAPQGDSRNGSRKR
ncbi:hypothetical protein ACTMTI_44250 [Nonomuraea sp. H19]|uniref:hypothetical protein n=1 Tax=Nonomuraea sp. H19 TaxID=3452206 RepID=UPI003F8CA0F4